MPTDASEIVFFDGVCNLCNGFVDFVIRRNSQLQFAPLQGSTAARLLPEELTKGLPSLVFYSRGQTHTESGAALRVLAKLGLIYWVFAMILLIVPFFFRNLGYRWIAKNRYKWFGQKSTCRLPKADERDRFLD